MKKELKTKQAGYTTNLEKSPPYLSATNLPTFSEKMFFYFGEGVKSILR
jgi:hypothetical protein